MTTDHPLRPAPTARPHLSAAAVLVALLVAVVAPAMRALYPILFEIGEDWSYPGVGAIGVLLYASPLLAAAFGRLRPVTAVWVGVLGCLASLGVVAAGTPITVGAAAAGTVLALVGLTVVVMHLTAAGSPRGLLLAGLLLGLALDTALRAALRTWDIVWRHDAVTVGVGLALTCAALAVAALVTRQLPGLERNGSRGRAFAVVSLGAMLALEFLFLSSPAFVGSQSGLAFWIAVTTVLLAAALALAALPAGPRMPVLGRWVVAVAAAVLAAVLTVSSGWLTVVLVVAAQVCVVLLCAAAITDEGPAQSAPTWRGPVAAAGAGALMVVLVFLWQFYVIVTLPFPRWAIPAAAAVLVGYAALRSRIPEPGATSPVARPARQFAAATAATTVLAGALLAITADTTADPVPPTGPLTVMTYNIRSAVDTQGQLRPDVIADIIRQADADVVLLQEVGRGWAVHGGIDTLAYLEDALGMQALFSPAADGQFGNAVLTTAPVLAESVGRVPYAGGQQRSYTRTELQTQDGSWVVVGAHLEDGDVRQTRVLFDLVDGAAPAVIAGDLNVHPDWPNAANLTAFTDAVAATGDRCRTSSAEPTSDCDRPDWILVSPDVQVESLEFGKVPASDHLPLIAALSTTSG